MQRFNKVQPGKGETDIFIYPPFQFRRVNSLLTNFHLPKSTLLMLVAAFADRRVHPRSVPASGQGALPLFQLRRLHADPVNDSRQVRLRPNPFIVLVVVLVLPGEESNRGRRR